MAFRALPRTFEPQSSNEHDIQTGSLPSPDFHTLQKTSMQAVRERNAARDTRLRVSNPTRNSLRLGSTEPGPRPQ
ncbi:hypothetical protein TNCV_4965751 [Trichonephila clavipes]|nr:hypothetical protein TNCV_4965751 [Trichonephila clavipes]